MASGDQRHVAKLVPASAQRRFEAGLATAEYLATKGIAAGAPVRTIDGALTATIDEGTLSLIEYVPGRPLGVGSEDQRRWATTLGSVHRALAGFRHPGLLRWHWVDPGAPHLEVEDWVRPAVTAAVSAMAALDASGTLSEGTLHGDPAPEAFLYEEATGQTGLIDWGSAAFGPLMFDVASAVMYAGGAAHATTLLDAYADAGPLAGVEIEATLPTLLRFRYAVQADYFARRIAQDDQTGLADPKENWKGLHDARDLFASRPLTARGIQTP